MFCAFDRELVDGVVMDHEGNRVERLRELAEDEVTIPTHDLHVHKTTGTPIKKGKRERCQVYCLHLMIQ